MTAMPHHSPAHTRADYTGTGKPVPNTAMTAPPSDLPAPARRAFLAGVGGLVAASAARPAPAQGPTAQPSVAACLLSPRATEGPFYVDDALTRSDIRDGRPGKPLRLRLRVVDANRGCAPVPGALVSVWHCDAQGVYSATDEGPQGRANRATRFLRGVQPTAGDGWAAFTTIYPGWYMPRAVHIHVKVLLGPSEVLTTQLYFADALNREVLGTHAAYRAHGAPRQPNAADPITGRRPNLVRTRGTVAGDDAIEGEFTLGIARA
jgi:protocatechuate 3,4-dioxygenase beta subunit